MKYLILFFAIFFASSCNTPDSIYMEEAVYYKKELSHSQQQTKLALDLVDRYAKILDSLRVEYIVLVMEQNEYLDKTIKLINKK